MDRRGQLLLLSGMLIAMAVALITLYLTTASISGIRVSYSPWNLPYYEMRMGIYESIRAIKYYNYPTINEPSAIYEFYENMSKIYARHGYFLVVNATENKTLNLYELNLTFKTDRVDLEVRKYVTKY